MENSELQKLKNEIHSLFILENNSPARISDSAKDKIYSLHSIVTYHSVKTLEATIDLGEMLWKIREGLKFGKHGKWMEFFNENIKLFSYEMANLYIRIFENKELAREKISELLTITKVIDYIRKQKKLGKESKLKEEQLKEMESILPTLRQFKLEVNQAKRYYKKHGIEKLKQDKPELGIKLLEKVKKDKEVLVVQKEKRIIRIEKLRIKLEKLILKLKKEEEGLEKKDKTIEEKDLFIFDYLNEGI
jgi:hypothetical protein